MRAQPLEAAGGEDRAAAAVPGHRSTAASKQPFIRATEIWVPTADRKHLVLGTGLYGPLGVFASVSEKTRFAYDEGLPGKAWATGHPIVLKDLAHSYFKRGEAARAAGLTCAVALPIFAGQFLIAVLVLFCGDDREHVGAVELWHAADGSYEMGLVDGYYGTADALEWNSRHIKFMRGIGLPGQVWASGMPVIMEDLGRSRQFLRWEDAERVGINHGIGIPCGRDAAGTWVLTLLSALGTPIARRFEAWLPNAGGASLGFHGGYCEAVTDLAAVYRGAVIAPGCGVLGHVWRSGSPGLSPDLAGEPPLIAASAAAAGLTTMVAMPVISQAAIKAVVAWYL
jgi:hypothetical protein